MSYASAAARMRAMLHSECATLSSEGEDSSGARFGAKGKHLTGRVPAKRAHRTSIAFPYENQRIIVDARKFHRAVGVADRHDRLARMTVDDGHASFGAREDFWLASHRAILAVERPQDELLGARRCEMFAVGAPAEGTNARRIARHAHVLAIRQSPAVQHRLLHAGDQESAVRADRNAKVRALPFKALGRRTGGVGKPECCTVVVRNRQTKPLRCKAQAGHR